MVRFAYVFVSGFLLMLTLNLYNDWSYERDVLVNLREHVYSKVKTRDITTVVDTALYYSSMLQQPTSVVYSDKKFSTLKRYFTTSSFNNFYFGKDACGAYASFFSRLMAAFGYETKIVQVNLHDRMAGHMSVVVMNEGKLLLVDPLFSHNFKDANGRMSDINTVATNWQNYYSHQLPANYVSTYNYQHGWRYTNWNKFGAFSRNIYGILCRVIGKEKVDNFSLYYYIKDFNKYYIVLAFLLFLFTFLKAIQLFTLKRHSIIISGTPQQYQLRESA